jgi:hypothetical protein
MGLTFWACPCVLIETLFNAPSTQTHNLDEQIKYAFLLRRNRNDADGSKFTNDAGIAAAISSMVIATNSEEASCKACFKPRRQN